MTPIDSEALLPIDALVSYAERLGWSERETSRKTIRVFVPPKRDGNREAIQLNLVVPASADFEDSVERLRNAVQLLAAFHDATPTAIIRSIREPMIDVITIRPIWRYGGKAPLSIITMSKLMSLTESFITHLIARQMQLKSNERVSMVAARGNTSNVAVRLIEPDTLELENQLTSPYGARVPFGRLVTQRLAKGLLLISDAQKADALISEDAPFDLATCLALLKLLDLEQVSSIRFSIAFGSRYPLDEVQGFEAVTLDTTVKVLLRQSVELLLRQDENSVQQIKVTGRIADISQKSKDDLFTFSVEVLAYLRSEKYWIQLPSKFLSEIASAKQRQLFASIEGELRLKAKRKYIAAVKHWEILEQ